MVISSMHSPRARALVALRRRAERERTGLTLVDGHDELRTALASGARPSALWYCPALVRDAARLSLVERAREAGAEVFEATPAVFERIAYRQAPDGWLAVLPSVPTGLDRLHVRADDLVLVCASVEKPGNLGAMLRTADAAGVAAVVASPAVTDWGNPNVVRASRGAVFTVPVAEGGAPEVIAWLRARGLAIVTASPDARVPFTAADLGRGAAVVVGAESGGLSGAWAEAAEVAVRIPMFGRVDSLNVATSAALLVYEALRQRGRLGGPGSSGSPG